MLFEIESVLGVKIRISNDRWNFIVSAKHPSMKGKEKKVIEALGEADIVRRSKQDHGVFLYYKKER